MKQQVIADVVEPVLARCGLELDSLDIVPAGKRSLVRVVVDGDGPHGRGPLLDDIADASREISRALDESPATGNGAYTLEVSSRGTSRPLTTSAHWRRNRGRLVKVQLGEDTVEGRIKASDEAGADLETESGMVHVSFVDVTRATIQVELNRPYDPELDDVGSDEDDADDEGDDTDTEEE